MRLFIAIELPEDVRQAIGRVQERLRQAGANASWTRPEGIHLTLTFLGEVPEEKVQGIMTALTAVAQGSGVLKLEVAGAGAFPGVKAPRVLWVGVTGETGRLASLQAAVEAAMERLGFEREARKFSPHLTLARIRFPKSRDNWQQVIAGIQDVRLGGFAAGHLSVMRSELRKDGAVYTEIGKIELK